MNINKRFLIIGIILLIAAWTGNIFYYQKHLLKEPVFTKHFYEITQGRQSFQLNYIDNINPKATIAGLVFPEIGPEFVTFNRRDYNSDERYYRVNLLDIILSNDNKIPDQYQNKVITKAEVHLSDGRVMNVDIGRIFITPNKSELGEELLQFESSSGSSNNTGQASYRANKDLKIQSISSEFPEIMESNLEVKINDTLFKDVSFPLEIRKGDSIKIQYAFSFEEESLDRSYTYDFPIYITTEDSDGEKQISMAFIHYWNQFPDQYDIDALKKDRRIK